MLVNIATEDEVSEAMAVRLVSEFFGKDNIGYKFGKGGNSYLISKLPSFIKMSKREPVLVLTDLDNMRCPADLIERWCKGKTLPKNLLIRVAVREVESWILADKLGISDLLGISVGKLPIAPDRLDDPKRTLLHLARKAKRDIRSQLLPAKGALTSQGIGYNRALSDFVANKWKLEDAAQCSDSLKRALSRIEELAERTQT